MMNIEDVAKKAGVSVVTVSRVINGATTVREKNRKKVLDAMKALNYEPNHAARVLASGKTNVIGLTIGHLNDTFLEGVVKAIDRKLKDYGYVLALNVVPVGTIDRFVFQKERVDGVILLCPTDETKLVEQLVEKDIPYVLIDNQDIEQKTSVLVDNIKGGYEATKHLIDLGHRDIAHIAGPNMYLSSRERKEGFQKALAEVHLKPHDIIHGDFKMTSGYQIVSQWIREKHLPTAIFAADDFIALGAMNALVNHGLKVPDDVSIIGYDDQQFASQYVPQLTTVKQPEGEIGEKGVQILMDKLSDKSEQAKIYRLEPELIVRHSTKALNK